MTNRSWKTSAAVALGVLIACGDDGGATETDEKTRWCRTFDAPLGTETVCLCADSAPALSVFESACEARYDGSPVCVDPSSATNQGSCPGDGTDGVPYLTTSGPPDNDCEHMGPDGECCDPDVTDCCVEPNDCPNYDYDDFPYQAPTSEPAPGSDYTASLFGSTVQLTFAEGESWQDADFTDFDGEIDYSLTDCGETYCPFFINRFTAEAATSLSLDIKIDSVTKTKTISNLEYHLFYPVLGNHLIGGEVFQGNINAGGMVFRTEFDLSGPEFASENGHYSILTRNSNTVISTTNPWTHTFEFWDVEFDLSTVTGLDIVADIDLTMTITDEPPVAVASVSHLCRTASAATVTFSSSGSSDPDADIAHRLWTVNGSVVHDGVSKELALVEGSHPWNLKVIDSRGARDPKGGVYTFTCP